MSRVGDARKFIAKVVCAACGSDDLWEGSEEVWRVNGQEGSTPERVMIIACECGSQQVIG
tara:strand:+ start:1906 stop:2085 length:180 start_codon:yes stop_codon:yes gene_type:complete